MSQNYLQHQRVRGVYKEGQIALRGRLQTELAVGGDRVVHEHDRAGQLAVVKDLKGEVCKFMLLMFFLIFFIKI